MVNLFVKPIRRFRHIVIDPQSIQPIYLQIVGSVTGAVKKGLFKKRQRLPSVNLLSEKAGISRDSVERAYRHLKKSGVVISVPYKGYYIR